MLEELLSYDRLASKDELLFLLFKAIPLSDNHKVSDLKKYCTSNHFSLGKSFDGTLKLLEFMAFISISEGIISINGEVFNPAKIKQQEDCFACDDFIRNLFLSMKRAGSIADFITPDAVRRDAASGLFYVRDSLIPLRFFGVRNLLISLGLFEWGSAFKACNLFVNGRFAALFEASVVNSLKDENRYKGGAISLSQLESRLNEQEELGKQAEVFALRFEQNRLQGHPSVGSIRRVSEERANAGFDIESFNDNESVFVDRYIEVKSYSGSVRFYWSQNEVDTAKELTDKYFLYLVDRNKMAEAGYAPRVFQNPYQKIFESEYWKREPGTWVVSAPD